MEMKAGDNAISSSQKSEDPDDLSPGLIKHVLDFETLPRAGPGHDDFEALRPAAGRAGRDVRDQEAPGTSVAAKAHDRQTHDHEGRCWGATGDPLRAGKSSAIFKAPEERAMRTRSSAG